MNGSDLQAPSARIKPWQARVSRLVERKLADAAAHAHLAVTRALRETPDGRPSAVRIRRSPSYQAALARLDELLTALAGPTVASTKGLIRDAAEAFYVESFASLAPLVAESIRVADEPNPPASGMAKIRSAHLHATDLRTELSAPIERAKRALGPAVASASSREAQGKDTIDTWHEQARRAIEMTALAALSDRDVAAHTLALLDVINPKHLDKASLAMSSHPSKS